MFRRERDARRTAKSIRNHQDTMEAFGRASLSNAANKEYSSTVSQFDPEKEKMISSKESYPAVSSWRKPEGVRPSGSLSRKVDDQKKKGLLTQGEAEKEKLEISARKGNIY